MDRIYTLDLELNMYGHLNVNISVTRHTSGLSVLRMSQMNLLWWTSRSLLVQKKILHLSSSQM